MIQRVGHPKDKESEEYSVVGGSGKGRVALRGKGLRAAKTEAFQGIPTGAVGAGSTLRRSPTADDWAAKAAGAKENRVGTLRRGFEAEKRCEQSGGGAGANGKCGDAQGTRVGNGKGETPPIGSRQVQGVWEERWRVVPGMEGGRSSGEAAPSRAKQKAKWDWEQAGNTPKNAVHVRKERSPRPPQ